MTNLEAVRRRDASLGSSFNIGVTPFPMPIHFHSQFKAPSVPQHIRRKMNALEVIGVLGLVYLGCRVSLQACKCIYVYLIRAARRRGAIEKEAGRWALVTGATDGIGKAYAHALADKGLKIILISRDPRKLATCASEITEKYRVETKVVPIDFTNDLEIFDTIKSAIQGLDIGVLVNNVGISYSYPELFLEVPDKEHVFPAIIRANVVAITKMCELVMPGMVQRKSGVVINISSLSAMIPSPYLAIYAATKAFVEKFSDDLRIEYEDKGLVIQTVLPGYVATNMSMIRKSTWMAPSPDTFVASALSKVGVNDHTTGYLAHTLMVKGIHSVLYVCRPLGMQTLKNTLEGIRAKAKKKKMVVHES